MDDIKKIADDAKVDTDRERVQLEEEIQQKADSKTAYNGEVNEEAQEKAKEEIDKIEADRRNTTS